MTIYFTEILLKRQFKDTEQWKTRKLNLKEFIILVLTACRIIRVKPSEEDLTEIFKFIDTDKDGYITFAEYVFFIQKYLGLVLNIDLEEPK